LIKVVLDTNVLVSALLTPSGNPARVLDHILNGAIVLCYDSRIITEYQDVLLRSKFGFNRKAVKEIVDFFIFSGISIVATPLSIKFEDEDDKKFFEVADSANAYLVTGNIKHFPRKPFLLSPLAFLKILESNYLVNNTTQSKG
jgi:putative PIN family toxin of toxin-antitoxin system